jgi:cytochrome c553
MTNAGTHNRPANLLPMVLISVCSRMLPALSRLLPALLLSTTLLPMTQAQAQTPVQQLPRFEDSIAQRTLACTACHGDQGRAAPDGYYPRLAGKPAAYLYNQLLHFREGRRHYGLMTQMVDPLNDAYLLEIAQYFADLKVPYPAPQLAPPGSAALLAEGRRLVQEGDAKRGLPACVQCHGQRMTGVLPQVPGLLGLPRDYLNAQLGAWKAGKRRAHAPDCMAEVVNRLNTDDIQAVSSWLAAQPVPLQSEPVAASGGAHQIAKGAVLAPACGGAVLPTPTGPASAQAKNVQAKP